MKNDKKDLPADNDDGKNDDRTLSSLAIRSALEALGRRKGQKSDDNRDWPNK